MSATQSPTNHELYSDDCTTAPPRRFVTFRDAVGLALELCEPHETATATYLFHPDGTIDRFALLHSADAMAALSSLSWTLTAGRRSPAPRRSLLITIDRHRPPPPDPEDACLFRWAVPNLDRAGAPLSDWIHTDGDLFRSAAYTWQPHAAWLRDPPHDRLIDLAMMTSTPICPFFDTHLSICHLSVHVPSG